MLTSAQCDPATLIPPGVDVDLRILQIAGDIDTAGHLRRFLVEHRMTVQVLTDESSCISMAASGSFDLVLLDSSLPHLGGWDVLRLIRTRCDVPVIVLTGPAPGERVMALELGADDCMSMPLMFQELLARVRAVLRRDKRHTLAPHAIQIRSVRIDPGSRDVWVSGRRVKLTATEYVILEVLMRAAGRVVTRERLAWTLRQREPSVLDRSLDVHVAHLRSKIGRCSPIRTVRGEGYFFCMEPME